MQILPTRMCKVTEWRHSRLRAHWLMALVLGWGGSMYSAFPENQSVYYLSFVYGRSLRAELNGGEILFTGRQTCSLYLVLWLCVLMLWPLTNEESVGFSFHWLNERQTFVHLTGKHETSFKTQNIAWKKEINSSNIN